MQSVVTQELEDFTINFTNLRYANVSFCDGRKHFTIRELNELKTNNNFATDKSFNDTTSE